MLKSLVKVFLILCMGWQSLVFAGFGALVEHQEQEQHELLHFQGVAHHHDEHAEDFHEDKSTASTAHCLSDACQFSSALPTPQCSLPLLPGTYHLSVDRYFSRGQLLPDSLDRPPKPTA
jgi:hypothetical protein